LLGGGGEAPGFGHSSENRQGIEVGGGGVGNHDLIVVDY
jgi:hypothetical protein